MQYESISKGSCLGIYGGILLEGQNYQYTNDDTYLLRGRGDAIFTMDGDNILSRVNTILQYDEHGKAVAQATEGYNVDCAYFNTVLNFESREQNREQTRVFWNFTRLKS